jgi:hypothetical protein
MPDIFNDPTEVFAEVPPVLDTLVAFFSDEIPHEVLPMVERLPLSDRTENSRNRLAISTWYLCPTLGATQFTDGTPVAMESRSEAEAAAAVLHAISRSQETVVVEGVSEWLRDCLCQPM